MLGQMLPMLRTLGNQRLVEEESGARSLPRTSQVREVIPRKFRVTAKTMIAHSSRQTSGAWTCSVFFELARLKGIEPSSLVRQTSRFTRCVQAHKWC
jgi:hypothetical protein